MIGKESAELKNRFASTDPLLEVDFVQHGTASAMTFRRTGGFRDLGNAMKVGAIDFGTDADFPVLIEEIKRRARAQGCDGLWGPLGFSTYFDYRLRLNGFENPPFPTEPANSEAQVALFEKAGFVPRKLFHSHEFDLSRGLRTWLKLLGGVSGASASAHRISVATADEVLEHENEIFQLTHGSFEDHFAYEPISPQMFRRLILEPLAPLMCERTSLLIRLPETDEIIGYSLHLRDPRDPKRILIKTAAVKKEIPDRSKIFFRMLQRGLELMQPHYDRALLCLTAKGISTERLARPLNPRTTDYALFYCPLT